MASHTRSIENGRSKTLMWARTPPRKHNARSPPQRKGCDEHGGMARVETSDLTVEKNGVLWEFDPNPYKGPNRAEFFYCPDCLDEKYRDDDEQGASDSDLLRVAAAEEMTKEYDPKKLDTTLFSVVEILEDANPVYCPYCSDELEETDGAGVECSVHGRLEIDIEAEPDPP